MALGNRLTKASGIAPEVLREYVGLTDKITENGIVAVLAELLGFTEQPPSPGAAADWGVDDWIEFGRRNNMTDVVDAKHGTKISHNIVPRICAVPLGTPGDVRAGMNCAADFRRAYRQEIGILRMYFQWITPMVTSGGLRIDGRSPSPAELIKAVAAFSLETDERILVAMGFPGVDTRVGENVEVSAAKLYSSMVYLASATTPAKSYPEIIMAACDASSLGLSRDKAGMLAKRIGQAYRNKEVLMLPVAVSLIADRLIEAAAECKERIEIERELRKAERVVEVNKTVAVVDAEAVVKAAVGRIRSGAVEHVMKMSHELAQLEARFEKVKVGISSLDFDEVEAVLLAQTRRASEAEAGVQLVNSALQTKTALLERVAAACGVEPGAEDLESALLCRISAMSEAAAAAERVRSHHVAFATKVHDKLSVKDFLSIAASINELLPEAERIALSGGEEE